MLGAGRVIRRRRHHYRHRHLHERRSKETISGAFTGDFNTRYRAQVKMSFDPPQQGLPPNWGVTIDAKFLGPDCGAEAADTKK